MVVSDFGPEAMEIGHANKGHGSGSLLIEPECFKRTVCGRVVGGPAVAKPTGQGIPYNMWCSVAVGNMAAAAVVVCRILRRDSWSWS